MSSDHEDWCGSAGHSCMESGSESSNSQELDLEYEAEAYMEDDAELKYFDTANAFNIDSTGEVPATGQLCLIPMGAGASARIGRDVCIHSLHLKWNLNYSPGAVTTGVTSVGIYLLLDKQANGAAAGVTDVFTGNELTQDHLNLENSDRFCVLKRWHLVFKSRAGVSADFADDLKNIEYFMRLNIPLKYSGSTGAITELKTNNIFVMASAFASDDLVTVSGTTRLRYSDYQ